MTRTKMTPEEKKARAEAKKQANLSILARIQYKHMDVARFVVEDRNDKHVATFRTTIIDGVVRSCEDIATGESCDGRHWSGHCCHGDRAMAYESERTEQLHVAAVVAPLVLGEFANDLTAHIVDELSEQESGSTDSPDEFEAERTAWASMTPDERRMAYCAVFDVSYGDGDAA